MIRYVADTNLLASATLVKEGAPNQILNKWLQGEIELATSPILLEELEDVLFRPRIQKYQWMKSAEVAELISHLREAAIQGPGKKEINVITEDPDDNWVLSAALETNADYIVSGDQHLRDLREYKGIKILSPAKFLKLLQKG